MIDSRPKRPCALLPIVVAAAAAVGSAQNVTVQSATPQGHSSTAVATSLSADGRYVVFHGGGGTSMAANDTNSYEDVFVRDRASGAVDLVSQTTSGVVGDGWSNWGRISADGRWVVFKTAASNLAGGGLGGGMVLRDRQLGVLIDLAVSALGQPVAGTCRHNDISPDARFIAFDTQAANVVAADTNGLWDAFVHDRQLGTTVIASVSSAGVIGNGNSSYPCVSDDGQQVLFASGSTNLVANDTNAKIDLFVRDLSTGTTELVDVSITGVGGNAGVVGGILTGGPYEISGDGRFVAFTSASSDLVASDTNGFVDVFVRDRVLSVTTRVSLGLGGVEANGDSVASVPALAMSGDGRFVVFSSAATNLIAGDGNAATDVFAHDRLLATTARASENLSGTSAPTGTWFSADVTDDGRWVLFTGPSTGLVLGDPDPSQRALLRDMQLVGAPMEHYCTAKTNSASCVPSIGASGAPLATGDDAFFVIATQELAGKSGIFFWGQAAAALPFGGGTLCVAPPLVRGPVQNSGGTTGCTGTYSQHFGQAYMAAHNVSPGDTLFGQYWSRDPGFAPPNNVALTRGLQFTVLP